MVFQIPLVFIVLVCRVELHLKNLNWPCYGRASLRLQFGDKPLGGQAWDRTWPEAGSSTRSFMSSPRAGFEVCKAWEWEFPATKAWPIPNEQAHLGRTTRRAPATPSPREGRAGRGLGRGVRLWSSDGGARPC